MLCGEGFTDETIEGAIWAVARRPDGGRDFAASLSFAARLQPAGVGHHKEPLTIPNEYGMLTAAAETFFQKIE